MLGSISDLEAKFIEAGGPYGFQYLLTLSRRWCCSSSVIGFFFLTGWFRTLYVGPSSEVGAEFIEAGVQLGSTCWHFWLFRKFTLFIIYHWNLLLRRNVGEKNLFSFKGHISKYVPFFGLGVLDHVTFLSEKLTKEKPTWQP